MKREEFYQRFVYSYVNRFQSQHSKAEKGGESDTAKKLKAVVPPQAADGISSYSSEDEDLVMVRRRGWSLLGCPEFSSQLFNCAGGLCQPQQVP